VLEPPPSRAVLWLDGKDVGQAILERVEPIRTYIEHLKRTPPAVIPTNRGVYMEAESGYAVATVTVAEDTKASGRRFAWCPGEPGRQHSGHGRLVWRINVPEAGDYHVWGRVLAPTPADDSFYLQAFDNSGQPLKRFEWHTGRHTSWAWTPVTDGRTRERATLALPRGTVRMELEAREDGTKIDRLFITPDANARPE